MPNCSSLTKTGTQCRIEGKPEYSGLCTRHHNMKMRDDAVYKAAFDARIAAAQAAIEARQVVLREQQAAAEQALKERKRAEKIVRRDRAIAAIPTIHLMKIIYYARRVVDMWEAHAIAGYDIPKAYAVILYKPHNTAEFTTLLTALVKLHFLDNGNHPDVETYRDVPQAEKDEVITAISTALAPFLPIDPFAVLPEGDKMRAKILARRRAERLAELEAERAAAEAIRQAQFAADLRERPVVFQRDPEGGINLRAFATDTQNIHRSSVQESTHKSVVALMKRPTLEGVEVLPEIVESMNDTKILRWSNPVNKDRVVMELTHDYFNTMAFDTPYSDVVDRVWAFVRGHTSYKDLVRRLAEELYEGLGMCSNGKMARLINVLQGFDETLETEAPKEVFQFRMAALRKLPMADREAAARALFVEFKIPEEMHEVWLDPLREDDEPPAPAAAGAAAAVAVGGAGLA